MFRTLRLSLRVLLVVAAAGAAVLPARAERLPAGTEIVVRLDTEINPASTRTEDFRGVLAFPVFVNGKMVLPADTRVEGKVRGDKKKVVLSPRYLYLPDGTRVNFNAAVKDLDRAKLRAEQKEGTIQPKKSDGADTARQAAEIGGTGAAIGAMSTRSMKGMGVGAAAGVAAVVIGHKVADARRTTNIPAGTNLTLSLSRPLDVPDNAADATARSDRNGDPDDRRPVLIKRDPPKN